MANRERGEQQLAVGAQVFVLRLTVDAACAVEELSGRRLDVLAREMSRGSARDLRWFLWAALQDHHGELALSIEAIGQLIDDVGGLNGISAPMLAFAKLNAPPASVATNTAKKQNDDDGLNWQRIYIQMRAAGIAPEAFWHLSLRELWAEVAVLRKHQRQEVERAYLIEYMARQKVLRAGLIEQLAPERRTGGATYADAKAMLEALSAKLGRPLKRIPWKPQGKPS